MYANDFAINEKFGEVMENILICKGKRQKNWRLIITDSFLEGSDILEKAMRDFSFLSLSHSLFSSNWRLLFFISTRGKFSVRSKYPAVK